MTAQQASDDPASRWQHARLLLAFVLVAAAWAVLRLAMTRQYDPASWEMLVELRAPLPFGHRVLIPLVARPFVHAGVAIGTVFVVSEGLATVALLVLVRRTLARDLPERAARLGAFGVLGALAFALLLEHRWPIFYPWDAWAMVAVVAAVDAIRRERLALATAIVVIGAYNRESVALVPLLGVALRLDRSPLRPTIAWAILTGLAYAAARASIDWIVPEAPGARLHVWFGDELRLLHNLRWLADLRHQLIWWASLAFLPLAWLAVRRWIPPDLHRTHVVALFGLGGLLVVANAYEPRVYAELIVLGWCAVWTGAWRWATGEPVSPRAPGWIGVFDRAAAVVLVALAVVSVLILRGLAAT
jgi:hypothetical protein